ncbi:receptor expression-enhancing protein 5-like [Histomonas meleagridis]|uniref:receptor expression-enhancing protein 5-like n=1 Tax=Histomonas meleagridis TaxID=135588 RepID=UPI00355A14AD|nr:receptor expression-enhancing protein 5-like [Histomonas meleagridis]KAH0803254.1 receptor expression-enhancing protein 5-like [Histomonas meleagridis]
MQYLADFGLYASNLLATALKVVYPAYASYKATISENKDDDTTWLIYWVVVAVESFIEAYLIPFVSWVPFFMIVRVLFYVWLQLPIFNGSIVLFKRFIRPFFEENASTFNTIVRVEGEEDKAKKIKQRKELRMAYYKILAYVDPENKHIPPGPWVKGWQPPQPPQFASIPK